MEITKLDVAIHQLNVAIRLFLEGDYLASLTLAGAAEEIFGRLCERAGHPVAMDSIIDYHFKDTDPALSDKERRKVIKDLLNGARNEAKHANNPAEGTVNVEQIFPLQMIMRAVPMCSMLTKTPSEEIRTMVVWMRDHPEAFE
jgi:hypothetical protein